MPAFKIFLRNAFISYFVIYRAYKSQYHIEKYEQEIFIINFNASNILWVSADFNLFK